MPPPAKPGGGGGRPARAPRGGSRPPLSPAPSTLERPGRGDHRPTELEPVETFIEQSRLAGSGVAGDEEGARSALERFGYGRERLAVHPRAADEGHPWFGSLRGNARGGLLPNPFG